MLKEYQSGEVDYFMDAYVPSFSLSLDEITSQEY
ncbi:MAG: 5'-deoxynucleotidase [Paraglaciecola sp.]